MASTMSSVYLLRFILKKRDKPALVRAQDDSPQAALMPTAWLFLFAKVIQQS
jgi:hypothetical protein